VRIEPPSKLARGERLRGLETVLEPLLLIVHVGYGWLAFGLSLLGLNRFTDMLRQRRCMR